jgi:hypothetical protein
MGDTVWMEFTEDLFNRNETDIILLLQSPEDQPTALARRGPNILLFKGEVTAE